MKGWLRHLVGGSLLLLLMAGQTMAQAQVQAQVDRSSPIYAGSRFAYNIVVADGSQPENIDLAPLKNYSASTPSTQSRTSIVNGRTSSYQILTYQLLAPSKGEHTIPSVTVTVDGKNYQTNPVEISVVEPGTTQQIDVEMELSTQACYVGQPVILTVSFYVWTDIVRAEQITNIGIQIPFLEEGHFYQEEVDSQLKNAMQTTLPVNGRKEYVYQDQILHKGVNCVRVRFIKVLIPKTDGLFELNDVSVTADLAVGQKQRRDRFFGNFFGTEYEYERFSVQAKPLQLQVQALPQAGRPADFYGLVGNYTISAGATPTEVNVGDPITLTIQVGGSQFLKPVQWPQLEAIPQMAESFKMPSERSDGEIINDVKVFTQTIRPSHDAVKQVPPIPLSFFDAEAGRYRTVYTEPVPLQVSPTRIVTGGDVETRQFSASAKKIEVIKEGVSANYTSLDALVDQHFSPFAAVKSPAFILLYAVPLFGLIASGLIRYLITDSPQRQAASKRKKAHSHALKRLRQAVDHEKPSQQVLLVLKQYIADKFDKSAGSLTAIECGNVILETTNDAELSSLYQEIMEQTEASEYSSIAFELTKEKQDQIIGLLSKIEKKIK
ncbi:MAG: BatD family protein [Planctomycetota bacterium]